VSLPVGTSIIGVRVKADQWSQKITRLDFLLGGDEVTFPAVEDEIESGNSSFDWTYEWPTKDDLAANFDVLKVNEDAQLASIQYKQYEG